MLIQHPLRRTRRPHRLLQCFNTSTEVRKLTFQITFCMPQFSEALICCRYFAVSTCHGFIEIFIPTEVLVQIILRLIKCLLGGI